VRHFKYARELITAGRKEGARTELRVLRELPNDFAAGKSEIGPLLGRLSRSLARCAMPTSPAA
jgi:hypothetical protein